MTGSQLLEISLFNQNFLPTLLICRSICLLLDHVFQFFSSHLSVMPFPCLFQSFPDNIFFTWVHMFPSMQSRTETVFHFFLFTRVQVSFKFCKNNFSLSLMQRNNIWKLNFLAECFESVPG